MSYSIRKNWMASFALMLSKPIVIMPFFIIAFLEGLVLELIYFSTRRPISIIADPIIRKYFGENSLHYPGNILILPKLFYYAGVAIYILIGVFLIAISINIFKNIRANLPIKTGALIKNASKQYLSFVIFGIIMISLIILVRELNLLMFSKLSSFGLKHLPKIGTQPYVIGLFFFLFLSNIILQTFLILTLPLIVIQKKSLLKALGGSIYLGLRNFFSLFGLIFLPFLIYFPITLLKVASANLAQKAFPEIILYVTAAGIILGVLIDCFIYICVSQFLLESEKRRER